MVFKYNVYYILGVVLMMFSCAQSIAGMSDIKRIISSSQTKFDWQASESSPKYFPMTITRGSLNFPGSGSLYVPNDVLLHIGWGRGRSSHVVGSDLKSLPNHLSISFFSYMEDQFYEGEFELPYDKILKMFQTGHYSPKANKEITYHRIIVGVAPGGAVSVWVVSLDRTIEVFFGNANKVKGNWESISTNSNYSRKEYVRLGIVETLKPEVVESIQKNGIPFGRWERYHKRRYYWQPKYTNMPLYDSRVDYIKYFNGERDYIDIPVKDSDPPQTRAVPSDMDFTWLRPNAKPRRIKLSFNEEEIFNAFEKIASQNQKVSLEFKITDNRMTITLSNDKESVAIKNVTIKTYGIPE